MHAPWPKKSFVVVPFLVAEIDRGGMGTRKGTTLGSASYVTQPQHSMFNRSGMLSKTPVAQLFNFLFLLVLFFVLLKNGFLVTFWTVFSGKKIKKKGIKQKKSRKIQTNKNNFTYFHTDNKGFFFVFLLACKGRWNQRNEKMSLHFEQTNFLLTWKTQDFFFYLWCVRFFRSFRISYFSYAYVSYVFSFNW